MLSMVQKYSRDFPKHQPSVATPDKDVVLVTGTTGGLGSGLLAELVASKDIIHVIAVNRKDPSGAALADRQKVSLQRQGLDPAIVLSLKVTLVEADLSLSDLGLSSDIFDSVCHRVSM
jgi:thioester reductase-like protein